MVFGDGGMNNMLTNLSIQRMMHLTGYPESTASKVSPPDVLAYMDHYWHGNERTLKDYMAMVGMDVISKAQPQRLDWCLKGLPSPRAPTAS